MKESSLQYLRCVRCNHKLDLEKQVEKKEIAEGFLLCSNCNLVFPIISQVPILWDDFAAYLSTRASLGGKLLLASESAKMKKFVKKSLSKLKNNLEDRSRIEKRWEQIYQKNKDSKFYAKAKSLLKSVPKSKLVLEHGCSIGLISNYLADTHELVFGIDSSFYSVSAAKKSKKNNLDFFVADSLYSPFGSLRFGLVIALNLLEIIEPTKLLKVISNQVKKGTILLSSPYDYERGQNSVKNPINEKELRKLLQNLGFKINAKTKKPNFIPWELNLNARTRLNYTVDVVLANRK